MTLLSMLDVPAKESPLFWGVIGVIALFILLIVLRDLILWYFKLNDVYDRLDDLSEKFDQLNKALASGQISGPAQGACGTAASSNEEEIAVAIALAMHASK